MDISKMKMRMLKTFEMNTYTPGNVFLIETLEAQSCSRKWLHMQPNKPALLRRKLYCSEVQCLGPYGMDNGLSNAAS